GAASVASAREVASDRAVACIGPIVRDFRLAAARCVASQTVTLQSAVERTAAEAQGLGCLADVAVEPRHGFLDQEALHLFEAHVLDARCCVPIDAETELSEP